MTKFNFSAAVFLVSDVGATARWYRDMLGFQFDTVPRTEPFEWASVRRDNVEIMLQRSEGYERPARDPLWPGDACAGRRATNPMTCASSRSPI